MSWNSDKKVYQLVVAASALDRPEVSHVSIGGSRDQVLATARVVAATRELNGTLRNPGSTLESVTNSINRKNRFAGEFLRLTGAPWPL